MCSLGRVCDEQFNAGEVPYVDQGHFTIGPRPYSIPTMRKAKGELQPKFARDPLVVKLRRRGIRIWSGLCRCEVTYLAVVQLVFSHVTC